MGTEIPKRSREGGSVLTLKENEQKTPRKTAEEKEKDDVGEVLEPLEYKKRTVP